MVYNDLDFAASCTGGENWASEGRTEFEGFFAHDPGGCLVAEEGERRIGIGIATPYGESGFIPLPGLRRAPRLALAHGA